ncbi:MAG: 50S ribosomal protein L3 [Candidatus Wildermuthbacteria bacterium]|nr:50S ribosomal protein L3 [Candidatus Wildermuthbacteria bacterium]
MRALLGKKIGMSRIFAKDGRVVPVTVLEAGPCRVLQVKTKEKDGYGSVQLGYEPLKKKGTKSQKGKEFRHIREFPLTDAFNPGDDITLSLFKEGEEVDVSGISKGKGFQGGVKRHGFHGRKATRGTKHEHRTLGSVGAARPSEVWKGKKMPGRMGQERVTVKNLEIAVLDSQANLVAVKGAVPGRNGILVEIRGA